MGNIFDVNQDELTKEQKIDLAKSRLQKNKKDEVVPQEGTLKTSTIPSTGWINLPIENLKSSFDGEIYYAPGTTIHIRPASSKEIRHYSSMDERDALVVDDKLNHILENCCKVTIPGIKNTNYRDILEIDRIYVVLAIRDLTFVQGENVLSMSSECPHCYHINQINIDKNNMKPVSFSDTLKKYYDPENNCFNIKTKEHGEFQLYIPKLGNTEFSKWYARYKNYANKNIDEPLLKLLMYTTPDYRKLDDKVVSRFNIDTARWDIKKMTLVQRLIDMIDEAITPGISYVCENCEEVNVTDILFQDGYKSLFTYSDILDELA